MLILSLLVILLPMGLGLFLWNQLPDQVPIHFGLNGQADNYAGKAFVVFGLPLLMAALQVLLLVVTMADPKGKNIAGQTLRTTAVDLPSGLAVLRDYDLCQGPGRCRWTLTWWEVCSWA